MLILHFILDPDDRMGCRVSRQLRVTLCVIIVVLFSLVMGEMAFIVAREGFDLSGDVSVAWGAATFVGIATLTTSLMNAVGAFEKDGKYPQSTP
ncbi:hypothetical protein ABZU32_23780 [Sphaerisporangium sp. NPDC005288]|uniref:hypothetical protein n=1 Tax=Sphaerisporangium sp. NPDC005288 TaxID=3155114 RepID=UPI0033BF7E01